MLLLTATATRSSFFLSKRVATFSPFIYSRVMSSTKITEGVEFDTIAREWRCKWNADNDKKSLAEAQALLNSVLPNIKKVNGVKNVQRVVCGGCLDFKVITSLPTDQFKEWEKNNFAPETEFLDKLKAINGISTVETQTYTLMPM